MATNTKTAQPRRDKNGVSKTATAKAANKTTNAKTKSAEAKSAKKERTPRHKHTWRGDVNHIVRDFTKDLRGGFLRHSVVFSKAICAECKETRVAKGKYEERGNGK